MIRNVAREIAMHLCYELSFTGLTAGELLEQRLASPYFESLAPESRGLRRAARSQSESLYLQAGQGHRRPRVRAGPVYRKVR